MKALKIILLLVLSSLVFSCVDEHYKGDGDKNKVFVYMGLNSTKEEVIVLGQKDDRATKAPSNIQEDKISDAYIMQFDGEEMDSKLINVEYRDKITSGTAFPVNIESTTGLNRILVLANVHELSIDPSMLGISYRDVLELTNPFSSEAEAYGADKGIIMSNDTVVSIPDLVANHSNQVNPFNFPPLIRSMAKVVLNLSIESGATFTVEDIEIANVPSSNLLTAGVSAKTTPYSPSAAMTSFFVDRSTLPTAGDTKTYQWYVPINLQGTSTNVEQKTKNISSNAANATAIRILAKENTATNIYKVIEIYLGENLTNDFNVSQNKKYNVTLKIKSINSIAYPTEQRKYEVVDYTKKTSSNCYMIIPSASDNQFYRIPVRRVDEFWTEPAYTPENQNALGVDSPWEVEFLWQNQPNVIRANDNTNSYITLRKSSGGGKDDYFEIRVPKNFSNYGSFALRLYKKNDPTRTTLWSWHFWVTDYDPYNITVTAGSENQKIAAKGTSAFVHRLAGAAWRSGGELQNSFIMDRSIGQKESSTTLPQTTDGQILLYQYGRKDPFGVSLGRLYDINGGGPYDPLGQIFGAAKHIDEVVKNPMIYGYCTGMSGSSTDWWVLDGSNYLWNDVKIQKSDQTGKSIYDPSPWGFKVPPISAFEALVLGAFTLNNKCYTYNTGGTDFTITSRVYRVTEGKTSSGITGASAALWTTTSDSYMGFCFEIYTSFNGSIAVERNKYPRSNGMSIYPVWCGK